MREAQREANEEAKAEYNPAAYGMNRAEEQLVYGTSAAVVSPPTGDPIRYVSDVSRRISPNR